MHLGVVAQGADVVGQLQEQLPLHLVGAEVGELGLQAGDLLGLAVVLLQGEADGVLVLDPLLLADVGVAPVVPGEPDLAEAHLPRLGPYRLGHVLARLGPRGRLQVPGGRRLPDERLRHLVVLLAVLVHVVGEDRPHPLSVGGLLYVLGLDRVLPAVEGDVDLLRRYAGLRDELVGDGDVYVRVLGRPTWAFHLVVYGLCHACTLQRLFSGRVYVFSAPSVKQNEEPSIPRPRHPAPLPPTPCYRTQRLDRTSILGGNPRPQPPVPRYGAGIRFPRRAVGEGFKPSLYTSSDR